MAKLVVGVNDLASQCPEVAAEWDYEKNGDVTPDGISYGSKKKAWWVCPDCGNCVGHLCKVSRTRLPKMPIQESGKKELRTKARKVAR